MGSQFKGRVHRDGAITATGTGSNWSCCIISQKTESGEYLGLAHFPFLFSSRSQDGPSSHLSYPNLGDPSQVLLDACHPPADSRPWQAANVNHGT